MLRVRQSKAFGLHTFCILFAYFLKNIYIRLSLYSFSFLYAVMSDYDYDSDSSGGQLDEMSIERIKRLASRYGYRMCQHDRREGVIAFSKLDEDGNKVLVRVWYRTGQLVRI